MDDHQIDQLLTGALRRRGDAEPAVAGDDCLDAETLAAWSAGTLQADAADRVEVHLSNCLRCQEIAAVFALAEPAAPPAVVPISQRPAAQKKLTRWVLPVAAALAASLVWFVWPVERVSEPASTLAKAVPPEGRADTRPAAPVETPPAPMPRGDTAVAEKNVREQRGQSAARADAKKDARDLQTDALAPVQPRAAIAPAPPARSEPPPPDPVTAGARPTTPPATEMPPKLTAAPVPAPAPTSAAGPPPAAPRQQAFAESVAADGRLVVAEFTTVDQDRNLNVVEDRARVAAGRGGGGGGRGGAMGGAAAPLQQAAKTESNALPRWRVLASGAIERSTDDGKSWTALAIDPPVHVISGASPARTTCWLIGRGGVVLLSTDGVRFQRVSSPPTSSELSTIRATTARQATVTTADGRSFVTYDGGATWRENGTRP